MGEKLRYVSYGCVPDIIKLHMVVRMNEDIAHARHLVPRYPTVCGAEFWRESFRSLTNYLELPDHGRAGVFRGNSIASSSRRCSAVSRWPRCTISSPSFKSTVFGTGKQSGGDIRVESEPGSGTRFEVLFPRAAGSTRAPDRPAVVGGTAPDLATVLVVEDEDAVREVVRRILARQRYRVLVAGDPDEALRICAEHDGPIDLLLTDVVMPGLNGRDLAGRVTALRPEVRVLYMSGYPASHFTGEGVLESGTPVLPKPFEPAAVVEAVQRVLGAPVARGGA